MLPEILESLTKMQQFASEHPEMAHVERSPTSYAITIRGRHPELMPNMVVLVGVMAVIFSKVTVLLAAAVTRRLHDCDKAGWWGIMPLPFVAFGLVAMPKLFAQPTPDTRLFFVLLLNNMLYIAALAWLVALLSGEGTKGANRYGQRP
ncbi:hypothetical protein ASE49_13830 [Novosphingobium sp. Leaf2]|nr:hypothetical protein ASE49_13830 [Novosphingobium sp. Leaf2]